MRIKTILLAIVTVITFGLTSCTEEFGGDNTQGKPGYLTINVKTLKLNQNKFLSDSNTANDYTKINNLNIFVFDAAGHVLLQKWISTTYTSGSNISIPVSTLATGATGDKVVAVANFGSDMSSITTMAQLTSTTIGTVGDFGTKGLHMTGQADIASTEGGGYESQVKIAPVEAKISVNWNLSSFVAQHYEVTGIYIVNAISETTLPIIRNSISNHEDPTPTWQNTEDFTTTKLISKTDKAQTGFPQGTWTDAEYKFYTSQTNNSDSGVLFNTITPASPSSPTGGTYHYYVGENYSYNSEKANRNTIVLIEVSPKGDNTTIPTGKVRYYTYELDKNSTTYNNPLTTPTTITTPVSIDPAIDAIITTDGFSTRRKVHYNLTFNLNSLGSEDPFKKIKSLNVVVTAEGWDDGGHAIAF